MQKFLFIFTIIYILFNGCSKVQHTNSTKSNEFSCTQEAKPKSLEFLEQQYRCTSQN